MRKVFIRDKFLLRLVFKIIKSTLNNKVNTNNYFKRENKLSSFGKLKTYFVTYKFIFNITISMICFPFS